MRNDSELALDEHELGAMMHLVLLRTEEPLEPGLDGFSLSLRHWLS
jgi:hypothetical protein